MDQLGPRIISDHYFITIVSLTTFADNLVVVCAKQKNQKLNIKNILPLYLKSKRVIQIIGTDYVLYFWK